jgi:hypothetical protein
MMAAFMEMTRGRRARLVRAAAAVALISTVAVLTAVQSASARTAPANPKPGFRVTLVTDGGHPRVGRRWHYQVIGKTSNGTPLAATAEVTVLDGAHHKVDGVGFFGFNGSLARTYVWGPATRGKTLDFRVAVVSGGTVKNINYTVHVD